MRSLFRIIATLVILQLPAAPTRADEPLIVRSAGKTVLGLEVEGARIQPGERAVLIPFAEGSALRPELVRQGMINIYGTGLYDKVEVFLKESPGGVIVRYVLESKRWLDEIEFRGNLYLDDRELLSRVNLRSSEELTEEKLAGNVDRLMEYYGYRGFVGTEVTYSFESDEDNKTSLFFSIKEGRRLMISDVRIRGDAGLSRTRLLSIITSMPGSRLDGENLDSDVKRIREHLRDRMYLTPGLDYTVQSDHRFPDAFIVNFNIHKGDLFDLQVLMEDDKEARNVLRKMRSVFLGSLSPEKAKLAIQKEILDQYRKEGYAFTSVNLDDRVDQEGVRSITLGVDRGMKATIGELRVEDVQFFSREKVESVLGLAAGDPYVKEAMDEGIADLVGEYRKEGFLSNEIKRHALNFIPRDGHQEVVIHLTVKEGPRNIISNVEVSGSPIQEKRTWELIGVRQGAPYDPERVNKGRDNLLQELGRTGYLYASVTIPEPVVNPDATVDLVISVAPGP
ncbi:MAG: hypothetical protein JSV70_09725, partial [bacterium]